MLERFPSLKKNQKKSIINLKKVSSTLDVVTTPSILIGGEMALLRSIGNVSKKFLTVLGTAYSSFEITNGYINAYNKYKKENYVKRHHDEKFFEVRANWAINSFMAAATIFYSLNTFTTLFKNCVSVVKFISNFINTVCIAVSWYGVRGDLIKLKRSIKKTQPLSLLKDRTVKYIYVEKKLADLIQKRNTKFTPCIIKTTYINLLYERIKTNKNKIKHCQKIIKKSQRLLKNLIVDTFIVNSSHFFDSEKKTKKYLEDYCNLQLMIIKMNEEIDKLEQQMFEDQEWVRGFWEEIEKNGKDFMSLERDIDRFRKTKINLKNEIKVLARTYEINNISHPIYLKYKNKETQEIFIYELKNYLVEKFDLNKKSNTDKKLARQFIKNQSEKVKDRGMAVSCSIILAIGTTASLFFPPTHIIGLFITLVICLTGAIKLGFYLAERIMHHVAIKRKEDQLINGYINNGLKLLNVPEEIEKNVNKPKQKLTTKERVQFRLAYETKCKKKGIILNEKKYYNKLEKKTQNERNLLLQNAWKSYTEKKIFKEIFNLKESKQSVLNKLSEKTKQKIIRRHCCAQFFPEKHHQSINEKLPTLNHRQLW